MKRTAKHVAVAALLASAAAWVVAQDLLLPTDWPMSLRDAANTSSTPVLPPDTLTPDWQIPTDALQNPLVYFTRDGRHLLISGNKVCSASDGSGLATLEQTGGHAAITTTTINEEEVEVLLTGDGSQFTAYDLSDYSLMWLLDTEIYPAIGPCWNLTAKDGVFYLAGDDDWIAAVDAASGAVVWEQYAGPWLNYGPPAVAQVAESTLVFLTFSHPPSDTYGFLALNAHDGSEAWSRPDIDSALAQCCVDEDAGVVYVHNTVNGEWLVACDASSGETLWSAPLDHILNDPPTLGWAKDGDGNLHPAVFAVTGGVDGEAGVYAFHRDTGAKLWSTTIPSDAHRSAVYCGCTGANDTRPGRLYIATNNNGGFGGYPYFGDTYVLDAFTGQRLQVLGTHFFDFLDNYCPVIVNVGGTAYMYVLTDAGEIVAWKQGGQLPLPPVYELSMEASPDQISANASAKVTVTLVDAAANGAPPVGGVTIQFSSNAAKNQGYVNPTHVDTNELGIATTTFYSQQRTGAVTVTARTPDGRFANTTITITKGGGEEPPASGSIQGTVYYAANGKPAKKATVQLRVGSDPVRTTTTNPRGKYSFQEVPFGQYIVWASANGAIGETAVEISESSPSVTADVYLTSDPAP